MKKIKRLAPAFALVVVYVTGTTSLYAQPLMETGPQKMPDTWIDKDTHHRIVRLTRKPGNNASFYFHNNPFFVQQANEGDRMLFYSTDQLGRQLYTVNLKSFAITQVTAQHSPMSGEIAGRKGHEVYYQIKDSVFATNADTRKTRLVYVFPSDFKGSITSLNANETLLGGARGTPEEDSIFKHNPEKHDFFNKVFAARLPRTLFTIDVRTGSLTKLFTDSAWLNHVQFSPTDPNLLMFCHEGTWEKVDRIWTIDIHTRKVTLIHKRTMENEIAGHEWFSPDGKIIYYDLQLPRGKAFYVGGTILATGQEKKYRLQQNEWSVHYNISPDQQFFAGDGGDPGAVAKAPDGQWIYLFTPAGDHFTAEKLVNMKHHQYKFEPNVHFTPDQKWIVFRANFEGMEESYAVEIKRS
jgi:oligogalacturonide lyase